MYVFHFFAVKPAFPLSLSLAINWVFFNRCQHGKQWFQGCCCFGDSRESELEPFSWEGFGMLRAGHHTLPAAAPNQVGAYK